MFILAAEDVHPPPRQPLAERRQGGFRRWIPRSGTLFALGDLVADADDADGGRDDSEDDEEVLGRSFTKGAWGLSSKKRQQPRARQRRRHPSRDDHGVRPVVGDIADVC